MNWLDLWVHSGSSEALTWTLAHSLWQGALAALILAIVFAVVRSPRVRHSAAVLTLAAIAVAFAATFVYERTVSQVSATPVAIRLPAVPTDAGDGLIAARARDVIHVSAVLPWLAPFWMAGVLVFQIRGLAAWYAGRRLSRRGVCSARPPGSRGSPVSPRASASRGPWPCSKAASLKAPPSSAGCAPRSSCPPDSSQGFLPLSSKRSCCTSSRTSAVTIS
jgi:hypothetical protein